MAISIGGVDVGDILESIRDQISDADTGSGRTDCFPPDIAERLNPGERTDCFPPRIVDMLKARS